MFSFVDSLIKKESQEQQVLSVSSGKDVSFTVFASMCIHREVNAAVINSLINLLFWPDPKFAFSNRG